MVLSAFSFGRKWGNGEVLLKEALMAAEAKGIEVRFYRICDYEVHNCKTCNVGAFCPGVREVEKCIYKDDTPFLVEEFLNSDGILMAAPVYALTPNSLFFAFRDRVFGPKMDIARELVGLPMPSWAKGRFKARPGGLISVGGALTEHWTSMGLMSLYSGTFSAQTEVVDHINAYAIADPGAATTRPDWLKRAALLGENVADALLTGDHRWRGDEGGICPCCHLNHLTMVPGNKQVICVVCSIYGDVHIEDGNLTFDWPDTEEYRKDNRLTVQGKKEHLLEIRRCIAEYEPLKEKAMEDLQKYKDYNACEIMSPSRAAKKAAQP